MLPTIDPKEEVRKSIDFLKAYLTKHPFKTFVLGISGGQDSTLAGRLAQLAMTEMREETGDMSYQFIAIRLPYGEQADEADQAALAFIQPDVSLRVDIKPAVDAMVGSLKTLAFKLAILIKEHESTSTYDYTICSSWRKCWRSNWHRPRSRKCDSFFTKYGDGGADILPLFRLNKRQGKALLKELGAPEALYLKIPTADLEDDKPLVADEVALGVTYDAIDDYLEGKSLGNRSTNN